jgi:hypothetical protein
MKTVNLENCQCGQSTPCVEQQAKRRWVVTCSREGCPARVQMPTRSEAVERWNELMFHRHNAPAYAAQGESKPPKAKAALTVRVTIEQMITEGSCTAKWAQENGYQWEAVVVGGDALAKRQQWLAQQNNAG